MRLALVLLTFFVLVAPASAAGPELGIADDRILLAGGPAADEAVAAWSALGIEQVRIYALWSRIAGPSPGAARDWASLDHAVDRVVAAGMKPLLTVTGPGPLWASRRAERGDPRYDPRPAAFADFAGAVAERYGDRVDRYVIWNEPNLGTWLRPQASCSRAALIRRSIVDDSVSWAPSMVGRPGSLRVGPLGSGRSARGAGHGGEGPRESGDPGSGCTPVGPHLYRALVRAAYPAIHAADPVAQVLIGAVSARGGDLKSENSAARPLAFLRGLGCVDTAFRRLRSGRCEGFAPARGDGFALHPHGALTAPDRAFPHPDDVGLASLARLKRVLDSLQRGGALKASTSRFNLYIDEYGYQTNPPDRIAGISATGQSLWLQRAAYQAWRDPRVKLFTQYLWRDEPLDANGRYSGWQSGLRYADGRAKPSLRSFPTPFVLDAARGRLWGQVRRRDTRTVSVERRLRGSSTWRTIGTRTTDARGYWSWTLRLTPGASYRYRAAGATSVIAKRR